LNLENLRTLLIALPPFEEQMRLENEAEWLLSTAVAVESSIQQQTLKAGRTRSGFLQRAFTGQLVPQDPTDEPASALLESIRVERTCASRRTVVRNAKKKGIT